MTEAEKKFTIEEHIAVLGTSEGGWKTELTKTKWHGGEIKYDIRAWSPDYTKYSKGMTLTEEEFNKLKEYCKKEEEENDIK